MYACAVTVCGFCLLVIRMFLVSFQLRLTFPWMPRSENALRLSVRVQGCRRDFELISVVGVRTH